jgi:hypothetical protein
MKNKFVFITLFILLTAFYSCTKQDRQEVKQTIDSASTTLGHDVDTILNKTLKGDSLFDKIKPEAADTSTLRNRDIRSSLNDIFDNYIDIKEELQDDDTADVLKQTGDIKKVLAGTVDGAGKNEKSTEWKSWLTTFEKINSELSLAKDLITQRKLFSEMSVSIENMIRQFGLNKKTVYKLTCSTMKEKSFWFTESKDMDNPYFGKDKSNEKNVNCVQVIKAWKFD